MYGFEIVNPPTEAKLTARADGDVSVQAARVPFSVARQGKDATGRLGILPQDAAQAAWFSIEGNVEREFPQGKSQSVLVAIRVPAGAPAGRAAFRLQVTAVESPDQDFAQSPAVAFDVAASKPRQVLPSWSIAAAIAVVLLLAATGYWLLWQGSAENTGLSPPPPNATVTMPPLVGEDFETVVMAIRRAGLNLRTVRIEWRARREPPARWMSPVDQVPAAGKAVRERSDIELTFDGEATIAEACTRDGPNRGRGMPLADCVRAMLLTHFPETFDRSFDIVLAGDVPG